MRQTCCEFHADTMPNGCRQGRDCPARQACELPEDDDLQDHSIAVVTSLMVLITCLFTGCFAWFVWANLPLIRAVFRS